jgi:hypothetical protein
VVDTYHWTHTYGHACHHGPHSIERFRALLEYLEQQPYKWFLIQEYDSLSLIDPHQINGTVRGNDFHGKQDGFLGTTFIHPPLFFDKSTLQSILATAKPISNEAEKSFWDRWLGYVCELGRIEVKGWGKQGFSQNTIEPEQIPDAVAAVKRGAVHIHGVKTQECYDAITTA